MNRWESSKTVIGWLIVFKTPCGEFWFKPDKNGNVRFAAAMATGHTIDLRALSAVVEQVKARYGVKRFGRKCSPLRGEFCDAIAAALNKAKLFPRREDAA